MIGASCMWLRVPPQCDAAGDDLIHHDHRRRLRGLPDHPRGDPGSTYAAQTPPPPINPGRPPRSRCIDALAESWCATLHQAVPCAQRQDVVVAHQRGGGDYLRINSLRRLEGKCRHSTVGVHAGAVMYGSVTAGRHIRRRCRTVAVPRGVD